MRTTNTFSRPGLPLGCEFASAGAVRHGGNTVVGSLAAGGMIDAACKKHSLNAMYRTYPTAANWPDKSERHGL